MAKMYGQLPSYIREHATVFDITVTDTVLAWEKEQYDRASGKAPPAPDLSVEEMQNMIKAANKEKWIT